MGIASAHVGVENDGERAERGGRVGETLQESYSGVELSEGGGVAEGIAEGVVETGERGDAAQVGRGSEG
ncbi:hypothetical protein BPOR_0662g00040 [Botrytis porri]|uniref:Uncharacterized protein n=1 Tax=Botrytis porri TaxID=87229 RepID=A0A4Z1KGI7_9HELO|nr:hypothetical protein BPOR_0662g00040 [Botrytis porri]